MSLRAFHLLFVLVAIVGADLFFIWAMVAFGKNHDPLLMVLGVLSLLGGVGLTIYGVKLVRKLDEAHIH